MEIQTKELYIKLEDGEIFIKQWSSEVDAKNGSDTLNDNTPIILSHDSIGCVELWGEFPMLLAKKTGRTIYAYDRLGFGKSSPRTGMLRADFMKKEALLVIPAIKKTLSITSYIAIGHSAGGSISVTMAALDSDCIAVISIASITMLEPVTHKGIAEAKAFFSNPENFARLEKRHGDNTAWVLNSWFTSWSSDDFIGWSLLPEISQVTCPALVIHGRKDEYGSLALPKLLAENTQGESELVILDDCAHFPHKEQPETVLEHIQSFLEHK